MTERVFVSALIAFVCCWRSPSNTVALAKDDALIALGAGQQDRMACVRLCLAKANFAGHGTFGSVFASDGFFPYAKNMDGLSVAEKERCKELSLNISQMLNAVSDPEEMIKAMSRAAAMMAPLDRREGPQLLVDAGCIGGVVPGDGKELEKVREFFSMNNLSVAFLPKVHRGFFKH